MSEHHQNEAVIKAGVLTITVYLDKPLAMSLGCIELSKDLVKQHYAQQAAREAQLQSSIIKPRVVN